MIIYPAIDLKGGHCVQFHKGKLDQHIDYASHPFGVAQKFAEQGAAYLHVVDCDGLMAGHPVQIPLIKEIKQQTGLKVQMGGGVRSKEEICELLALGIDRVVVGTIAVSKPDLVKMWLKEIDPDKVVIALDVRSPIGDEPWVAAHHWQQNTAISLWQLLDEYHSQGVKHLLCTQIDLVGTLEGPDIALYEMLSARYPDIDIQASGGISGLHDLKALNNIGISGTVIGKALYENKLSLSEAIMQVAKDKKLNIRKTRKADKV